VQWNSIKKCVLATVSDLVGKVDRKARTPWITKEINSKMDKRRKYKNVNYEGRKGGRKEGRKNYRRLRNEFKRDKNMAKKKYLESILTRS
jgi:hypothetical protein